MSMFDSAHISLRDAGVLGETWLWSRDVLLWSRCSGLALCSGETWLCLAAILKL